MARKMRSMPLVLLLFSALMFVCPSFGQQSLFEKAPPHVDEALRARISFFYQAHVDGKFRLADTVVHEDSKDAFFVADKNKCEAFKIIKIVYEEGYTKASATVAVDTDFFMPGFGKMPTSVPLTTFWKFDEGEWWWYTNPEISSTKRTPFGIMRAGKERDSADTYEKIKNMPTAGQISAQFAVDREQVELDCAAGGEETVNLANSLRGEVFLTLSVPENEDFTARLSQTKLGYQDKAVITFACTVG